MECLAVTAGGLGPGGAPTALFAPASRDSQPGRLEGGQHTVGVAAGALGAPEVDSNTAVGGGLAKHCHSLGCSSEGEGWVANHYQPPAVGGLGHQLLQCDVVELCEVREVEGVISGKLFQYYPLPQGWIFRQGPLHCLDNIPDGLVDQVSVG